MSAVRLEPSSARVEEWLEAAGADYSVDREGITLFTAQLLPELTATFPELKPQPSPSVRWSEAAYRGVDLVPVTKQLTVICYGSEREADAQYSLTLAPGESFGIGTHPTTQLVAEFLEEEELKGASLLDVGTGSGILALYAEKLGARPVLGIDIDPIAVEVSYQNRELNQSTARFSNTELAHLPQTYDIVTANLLSGTIRELWPELLSHCDSTLIISGILIEEEIGDFLGDFSVERREREGWCAYRIKM